MKLEQNVTKKDQNGDRNIDYLTQYYNHAHTLNSSLCLFYLHFNSFVFRLYGAEVLNVFGNLVPGIDFGSIFNFLRIMVEKIPKG